MKYTFEVVSDSMDKAKNGKEYRTLVTRPIADCTLVNGADLSPKNELAMCKPGDRGSMQVQRIELNFGVLRFRGFVTMDVKK